MQSVKRTGEKIGGVGSYHSAVRFTDYKSSPPFPSSKLLGYSHSSALRTDKSTVWVKPFHRQNLFARTARGKRQNGKRLLSPHNCDKAKANVGVSECRGVTNTVRRAQAGCNVEPITATNHPILLFITIFTNQPRTPISRCTVVGTVIPVLTPLKNVAVHVVESPSVGWEAAYRHNFFSKDPRASKESAIEIGLGR